MQNMVKWTMVDGALMCGELIDSLYDSAQVRRVDGTCCTVRTEQLSPASADDVLRACDYFERPIGPKPWRKVYQSMRLVREYRKFRAAGFYPAHALSAARTSLEFDEVDEITARIISEPEMDCYFDVFGEPEGYTDANGREVSAEEERKEICDSIDRLGNWIVSAQVRDSEDDEWETIDSVGMCNGYERPCDPLENCYVPDLMRAALDELSSRRARQENAEQFAGEMAQF